MSKLLDRYTDEEILNMFIGLSTSVINSAAIDGVFEDDTITTIAFCRNMFRNKNNVTIKFPKLRKITDCYYMFYYAKVHADTFKNLESVVGSTESMFYGTSFVFNEGEDTSKLVFPKLRGINLYQGAFPTNSDIHSLEFPELLQVNTVSGRVAYGNITDIKLPKLTYIGNNSSSSNTLGSTNIEKLYLPSLKTYFAGSFGAMPKLKSILIGGDPSYYTAASLLPVKTSYAGVTTPIETIVFTNYNDASPFPVSSNLKVFLNNGATLYLPRSVIERSSDATEWPTSGILAIEDYPSVLEIFED